MASWFHAAVLATALVATVAIGLASAAMVQNSDIAAPRGDRLAAIVDNGQYQTVETRSADGSVLARIQAD